MTRQELIAMYNEGFDHVLELEASLPRTFDLVNRLRKIKQQQLINQELDKRINPPVLPHVPLCVQIKEIY